MSLSDSEWKVMNVLWDHHPATARDVMDALGSETGWAYTTLKTILSRLVDKGEVAERKSGNRSLYEPVTTRAQARRAAVRALLDRAFDGAFGSLFHYLVDDQPMSPGERRELRAALREAGKRGKSR